TSLVTELDILIENSDQTSQVALGSKNEVERFNYYLDVSSVKNSLAYGIGGDYTVTYHVI
ncbi:MAG: hypothetical protein EBR47_10490, partial [Betaproteobacteria bacterium]|nr:hypothetical protein [Betaproteobacteria bacterium]